MPGLVPGIHAAPRDGWCEARSCACACVPTPVACHRVDGRDKPGHDGVFACAPARRRTPRPRPSVSCPGLSRASTRCRVAGGARRGPAPARACRHRARAPAWMAGTSPAMTVFSRARLRASSYAARPHPFLSCPGLSRAPTRRRATGGARRAPTPAPACRHPSRFTAWMAGTSPAMTVFSRARLRPVARSPPPLFPVMPGPVPGIHAVPRGGRRTARPDARACAPTPSARRRVDGRDEPGHDGILSRPHAPPSRPASPRPMTPPPARA